MKNILKEIIENKRREVETLKQRAPVNLLEFAPLYTAPVRPFREAILASGAPAFIAELKKASPSAGLISADFSLEKLTAQYTAGGAAALSVLTESKYFQGGLANLAIVRSLCGLPLLRKDFIFDSYQVHEARAAGADCILLIAAALTAGELKSLASLARSIGLQILVEIHDSAELESALNCGADIVGVNNRNLKTLVTDLAVSEALADEFPKDICRISESGIKTYHDVRRLLDAGYAGFLVGETLVRSADPAKALQELRGA